MQKFYFISILVLLVGLLAGCGVVQDTGVAENLAAIYYESIKAKNFDKAQELCGPQFFQRTSREDFLQLLQTINKKLGNLQSYKLAGFHVRKQIGIPSGNYYILQYKVTYSKYSAAEVLTLFKPSGGEIKILGYNVNSEGFFKE
ncbi:MAG: DUF4019 domain-containing protein [Candidatus Omnitrophota bacterium]|nr:MAG: DUF4019 domain-containing protein [Candidatus Omnitrophota bacterium]